jgi:hypothetical protein
MRNKLLLPAHGHPRSHHGWELIDIENGYELLADLTSREVTLYCAFGQNLNQFMFKNEMEVAHRVFCQLETWRKESSILPKDITYVEAGWSSTRKLPDSVVYVEQR